MTFSIVPACAPATLTSWPAISPRASSKITSNVAVEEPCALEPSTNAASAPAAAEQDGDRGEPSHCWSSAGLQSVPVAGSTSGLVQGLLPSVAGGRAAARARREQLGPCAGQAGDARPSARRAAAEQVQQTGERAAARPGRRAST